uniref:non-specific serine/threonine protein kinase n=1 Tax=Cyclopterus lumpus TaxID=8103 RepID=A0A8C3AQV9_CYCLU
MVSDVSAPTVNIIVELFCFLVTTQPHLLKHSLSSVSCFLQVFNGRTQKVPIEALLMLRAGGGLTSVRKCAAVSLIDWYDLDQEVLLIMERPVPCVDLLTYLDNNNGPLSEDQAKVLKLGGACFCAAIQMLSDEVFHRDIKTENVLIETDSDVPRVRIIDFGCGCFVRKRPYCNYSGTSAYAPPEFYLKGKYKAGPTTVWQLGALLFELLDGHKQFITSEFLQRKISINSELSQGETMLLSIQDRSFVTMIMCRVLSSFHVPIGHCSLPLTPNICFALPALSPQTATICCR